MGQAKKMTPPVAMGFNQATYVPRCEMSAIARYLGKEWRRLAMHSEICISRRQVSGRPWWKQVKSLEAPS